MRDDLFSAGFAWSDGVATSATPDATSFVLEPPQADAFEGPLRSDGVAGVAAVAGVAKGEGEELSRRLMTPLAGHVATVATVASESAYSDNPLETRDFVWVSQEPAATRATPVATVNGQDSAGQASTVAAWSEGVARLRNSPEVRFYHGRWYQMVADARAFLSLWANDALAAGWSTLDVFGVNPDPSHARYDRLGLVTLLRGRAVQELGPDSVTIGNSHKDTTTYYRRRRAPGGVPVWQWCLEGSQ